MSESTGRWVTDAGDERLRAPNNFRCMTMDGQGCDATLTAPFYEPRGPRHPAEVVCPSCALAHFGVRPPGREMTECGHAADDEGCVCWGVVSVRVNGADNYCGVYFDCVPEARRVPVGPSRVLACNRELAERCAVEGTAGPHGPQVLRYEPRRHDAAVKPATAPVAAAPAPQPPSLCHLDWCSAPTHSTFCSPNCERAHEDRIAAVARREAFLARVRHGGSMNGMRSEIAWAEAKTAEEIETIRRAWSALRHTAAEGNEGAFANTGEG